MRSSVYAASPAAPLMSASAWATVRMAREIAASDQPRDWSRIVRTFQGGTPTSRARSASRIARYLSAPRGMREVDLAREVGVPPWKVRTIRDQSRGWSEAAISRAIRTVAQADADIKGRAHDASYTLERMVLTVTGLHDRP